MRTTTAIVAALGAIVDAQPLIAAVDDIVKDRLVAARHIERFQDAEVAGVLDPAALVARCFAHVDDDLV